MSIFVRLPLWPPSEAVLALGLVKWSWPVVALKPVAAIVLVEALRPSAASALRPRTKLTPTAVLVEPSLAVLQELLHTYVSLCMLPLQVSCFSLCVGVGVNVYICKTCHLLLWRISVG
jgi:hypothetical protein